jgi:hypothetical protein
MHAPGLPATALRYREAGDESCFPYQIFALNSKIINIPLNILVTIKTLIDPLILFWWEVGTPMNLCVYIFA